MQYLGLVVLFVFFPIVIVMLLGGWGVGILSFLGVSVALGFLLNLFKGG